MNAAQLNAKNPHKKGEKVGASKIVTIFLSVIFLGVSGLLVVNSVKSVSTANQRNQLLEQAESEVRDLRLRNLELLQELDYVTSSSYVEEEARNRLLYTKDDEVLVVLPQTAVEGDDEEVLGEEAEKGASDIGDEGWIRWWTLLRDGV